VHIPRRIKVVKNIRNYGDNHSFFSVNNGRENSTSYKMNLKIALRAKYVF
jgi:hypothetical protein